MLAVNRQKVNTSNVMKITLIISLLAFLAYITIISQKLVTIGAILILRSILTTVFTSFVSNSWYGFILFLIYITGLLVLFGYFLAIRPNIHHSAKNCFKAYTFFFCLSFSQEDYTSLIYHLIKFLLKKTYHFYFSIFLFTL